MTNPFPYRARKLLGAVTRRSNVRERDTGGFRIESGLDTVMVKFLESLTFLESSQMARDVWL